MTMLSCTSTAPCTESPARDSMRSRRKASRDQQVVPRVERGQISPSPPPPEFWPITWRRTTHLGFVYRRLALTSSAEWIPGGAETHAFRRLLLQMFWEIADRG